MEKNITGAWWHIRFGRKKQGVWILHCSNIIEQEYCHRVFLSFAFLPPEVYHFMERITNYWFDKKMETSRTGEWIWPFLEEQHLKVWKCWKREPCQQTFAWWSPTVRGNAHFKIEANKESALQHNGTAVFELAFAYVHAGHDTPDEHWLPTNYKRVLCKETCKHN